MKKLKIQEFINKMNSELESLKSDNEIDQWIIKKTDEFVAIGPLTSQVPLTNRHNPEESKEPVTFYN